MVIKIINYGPVFNCTMHTKEELGVSGLVEAKTWSKLASEAYSIVYHCEQTHTWLPIPDIL